MMRDLKKLNNKKKKFQNLSKRMCGSDPSLVHDHDLDVGVLQVILDDIVNYKS